VLIPDANALVPLKDPIALSEKISWFLENENARKALAEILEITARERYGLDRMIDATEELYRRL